MRYGTAPEDLGEIRLDWDEYCHWLYCPIEMGKQWLTIPDNLSALEPLVYMARLEEADRGGNWEYIYLTARKGFATPGNPLNRPGWHADGFGTPDINYIWTDAYPTLFAEQEFHDISTDHVLSAEQFTEQIDASRITRYPLQHLLRLDASVIHAAPNIDVPGERAFAKISFSNDRYNLRGNSHNYGLDYEWKMWDRAALRNDPSFAGGDSGPQ